MSINTLSRLHLLNKFKSAPNSALFNQNTVVAVLSCSRQLLERNRWVGIVVSYIKMGRKGVYRKRDVLDFVQR
ncbi:DNA-binding protein [Legionella sainthelensi]|uniref:DNA-binding protein n=1 Tax=Legionella sainthelensi TaxID=28087 RepID=UPI000E203FDD|nr:DNA-binding protein [Legionella sainthelensi]